MTKTLQRSFNLIYPQLCLHCKEPLEQKALLCPLCLPQLSLEPLAGRCKSCFLPLEGGPCPTCSKRKTLIQRQMAAVCHMGPAITLLQTALNKAPKKVVQAIAALMAYQWIESNLPPPQCIIPIPPFSWQRYTKGFDLNHQISCHLVSLLNIPLQPLLKRTWDKSAFYQEGKMESSFCLKKKGSYSTPVLLVTAQLDDPLLQKVAAVLKGPIYVLAFSTSH